MASQYLENNSEPSADRTIDLVSVRSISSSPFKTELSVISMPPQTSICKRILTYLCRKTTFIILLSIIAITALGLASYEIEEHQKLESKNEELEEKVEVLENAGSIVSNIIESESTTEEEEDDDNIGPTGPEGPEGAEGPEGPEGPEGEAGADGADGVDGGDGIDGVDGVDGAAGIDGEKGEKGDEGDEGSVGEKGEKGDAGDTGEAGQDGSDGEEGIQGIEGEKGEKGDSGEQGVIGASGTDGQDGEDGQDLTNIPGQDQAIQETGPTLPSDFLVFVEELPDEHGNLDIGVGEVTLELPISLPDEATQIFCAAYFQIPQKTASACEAWQVHFFTEEEDHTKHSYKLVQTNCAQYPGDTSAYQFTLPIYTDKELFCDTPSLGLFESLRVFLLAYKI